MLAWFYAIFFNGSLDIAVEEGIAAVVVVHTVAFVDTLAVAWAAEHTFAVVAAVGTFAAVVAADTFAAVVAKRTSAAVATEHTFAAVVAKRTSAVATEHTSAAVGRLAALVVAS